MINFRVEGEICGVGYGVGFFGGPVVYIQRHTQQLRFPDDGEPWYQNAGKTAWKRANKKDFVDLIKFSMKAEQGVEDDRP